VLFLGKSATTGSGPGREGPCQDLEIAESETVSAPPNMANDTTHHHHHHHHHQADDAGDTTPTTQLLHNKSHDGASPTSSWSSTRQALTSLERSSDGLDDEELDLEDGFAGQVASERDRDMRTGWCGIKDIMTVRSRRRGSPDSRVEAYKDHVGLNGSLLTRIWSKGRRRRTWYNYCLFGGISGLTILLVLHLPAMIPANRSVRSFSSSTSSSP